MNFQSFDHIVQLPALKYDFKENLLNSSSVEIVNIFQDKNVYLTVQIQFIFVSQMSKQICDLITKVDIILYSINCEMNLVS